MDLELITLKETVGESRVIRVPRSKIRPFENQPRTRFNRRRLEELAAGIKENGQKKPIHVRTVNDDPVIEYEIIDGERRWQACEIAGIDFMRCIIDAPANEREQYLDSVTANFGGEPHTDIEEINAVHKMRVEYKMTVEQIASRCCQSVIWVYQRLRIAEHIDPEVIGLMDEERPKGKRLTFSAALLMVNLKPEDQKELAVSITEGRMRWNQARQLIEKRIAINGIRFRGESNAPRKRHVKLVNFLNHSVREFDTLLERDLEYFAEMFRNRSDDDKKSAVHKLTKILESARALKLVLEDVQTSTPDS